MDWMVSVPGQTSVPALLTETRQRYFSFGEVKRDIFYDQVYAKKAAFE